MSATQGALRQDGMLGDLARALGSRVRFGVSMRDYTAMRTGGSADALVVSDNADHLARTVAAAREHGVPWVVLGGGCNVLVADAGLRGLVVICRAGAVEFLGPEHGNFPTLGPSGDGPQEIVRAEAGASLSGIARDTVQRGMAGLEWASGLPGSVGGAVVGNAGAFEGDIAGSLVSGQVLAPDGRVRERPADWFQFDYRTSRLKARHGEGHVLIGASFGLVHAEPERVRSTAEEILAWRRTRHPAGATMGSTFKNPPGSHAGYLIEQAGLRGHRIGGAEVSPMHGNFLMNTGTATSADVLALIDYVRSEVMRQFGVELELEIELLGQHSAIQASS